MPEVISGYAARCIYHLLGRALGESVAITKVVDLDVTDKVSILCIYFSIESIGAY